MHVMQATPCDPWRSKPKPMRSAATSICVLGGALLAACTASGADISPRQDELFFPTGSATTAMYPSTVPAPINASARTSSPARTTGDADPDPKL